MALADLPAAILDSGRDHAMSRQFRKEVVQRRQSTLQQLLNSVTTADADAIHMLGARLAELDWMLALFDVKGT